MQKFLVFQLYGPISAYGDTAVGEDRHVFAFPGKTAVTGLLAASLGIRREEGDAVMKSLCDSFTLNLLILSRGKPLVDFHIVQSPKAPKGVVLETRRNEAAYFHPKKTQVTSRDYRTDSYVLVALKLEDSRTYAPDDLLRALEKPVFQPYLGRKCCPLAMPLYAKLAEGEDATSVLTEYFHELTSGGDEKRVKHYERFFRNIGIWPNKNKKYDVELISGDPPKSSNYTEFWRSTGMVSASRRQFSEEKEFSQLMEV